MSSDFVVFVLNVTAFNFFIVCPSILSFAFSRHYGHGTFPFLIHFLKRRGLLIVGGILLLVFIAGIGIAIWLLSGGDMQISNFSMN